MSHLSTDSSDNPVLLANSILLCLLRSAALLVGGCAGSSKYKARALEIFFLFKLRLSPSATHEQRSLRLSHCALRKLSIDLPYAMMSVNGAG